MGIGGDVRLVGDHHDSNASPVQLLKDSHDFNAGSAVEVAGRLIREQDLRVINERPRNGDALLLSARKADWDDVPRGLANPLKQGRGQPAHAIADC